MEGMLFWFCFCFFCSWQQRVQISLPSAPSTQRVPMLRLARGHREREKNKCRPPQPARSLSLYHSRQIVFTPDPTTATKDPPAHPITANQITEAFPFLVSKGHSLSWFFSFNSCKGIDPHTHPEPPAPLPRPPPPLHAHTLPSRPLARPLSARESGGRNRGLSIYTQTVGQPKKPQWIVTHYWNYQALIKLATLSPLGCAHLQLNFSSSDSNREAALAATGC